MSDRAVQVARLQESELDVLIIGGGINGAVSAAALSAVYPRVGLVERGDFASCTSQESSNLVWGGIKYLENHEFGLVRNLCRSRNRLLQHYPNVIREIRFLTVHTPAVPHHLTTLQCGTWLYWCMGNGQTRPPKRFGVRALAREEPVLELSTSDGGLEYSDAYLPDNDARFVFRFVKTALAHGAAAANYVEAVAATHGEQGWEVTVQDRLHDERYTLRCRVLINAAGPFADSMTDKIGGETAHQHVLSKGVHLIVPQLTPRERVLTFFADDGRPFFVIPMAGASCVGTTDTLVDDPCPVATDEDRDFILDNINERLALETPLNKDDIIAERCGVRPLAVRRGTAAGDDWFGMSRHHVIEVDEARQILTVFGGKLTDCLNIGEEMIDHVRQLSPSDGAQPSGWFGEPNASAVDFGDIAKSLPAGTLAEDPTSFVRRLWRLYGVEMADVVDRIKAEPELAAPVFPNFPCVWAEVHHAAAHEMIGKLEDFVRRRTPIGLVTPKATLHGEELAKVADVLLGEDGPAAYEQYVGQHQ